MEVKGTGPGFRPSVVAEPAMPRESGWGLFILDRLADRWGVDGGGESSVWFEIDDEWEGYPPLAERPTRPLGRPPVG